MFPQAAEYYRAAQRSAAKFRALRWSYVQLPQTNSLPIPLFEVFNRVWTPVFSPDDRWLAFTAAISGEQEIWAAEFPTLSNRVMVSREGGRNPVWARNARELFFLSRDGRAMMSARMQPDQGRFDATCKSL